MARLTLRIDLAADRRIGPGKILLLEQIRATGSISAAGRAIGMSYKRAWELVDELNRTFREPVVTSKLGGPAGGGTALTLFGERLVTNYREMEFVAHAALQPHLAALTAELAPADSSREPLDGAPSKAP